MNKRIVIFAIAIVLLAGSAVLAPGEDKPIDISSQQMETLNKGKVAFFSGQVKVTQEQGILYADKVWHYLAEDRLEASGNVHYQEKKDQETTDIYGGRMVYNRQTGYGTVSKSPKIVRLDAANPKNDTTITGDLIEMFNNEKRAKVSGNVNIVQPAAKAKSEVADYYYQEKKLVLTGNPWVWQQNEDNISEYTGKVITVFTENERVIIEENVQAKITSIKKEKANN